MNPELMTSIKDGITTLIYLGVGAICIFVGVKNLLQPNKKMSQKWGSALFWIGVGLAQALGKYIQDLFNPVVIWPTALTGNVIVGVIVVVSTVSAILNKVFSGDNASASPEEAKAMSEKIGYKIFIPALMIGAMSLVFAFLLPAIGAIPGLAVGVLVAAVIILHMSGDNPIELLNGGKRLVEVVGPLSLLPQLLASLGAVFTSAGVGALIARGVGFIVPQGNVIVGIIVYAVGMALFTMIMGNAFAAFSVMTVGIGIPFVLQHGLDPNVIGMLALTSGYCGTLLTPMAANFNIVPVAVLDMKDKYGVIKNQAFIAVTMLVIQILLMIIMTR